MEETHLMKLFSNIMSKLMYVFALCVLLAVGAFFALPHVPQFGTLDVKIVKSGSMEPAINTGGVVLIREMSSYGEGDVITFTSRGSDIPTTHRIIGTEVSPQGEAVFVTKGDANEERDIETVRAGDIIGTVLVDAPYVGFLLDFARQPLGFALLIGLPALLIVVDEIEKIWKVLRARKRDDDERDESDEDASTLNLPEVTERDVYAPLVIPPLPEPRRFMMHDILPKRVTPTMSLREKFAYETRASGQRLSPLVLALAFIFGLASISHPFGGTIAFYRNIETSTGNTLSAETIDFYLEPDGTVFTFIDGELDDLDGAMMTLAKPTSESSPLRYDVSVEFATGTLALCDAIHVIAGAPINFGGMLTALHAENVTLDVAWTLAPSLNVGAYELGDVCEVDIVYRGWNRTQDPGDGYEDEERVTLTFTTAAADVLPFASLAELSIFLVDEPTEDEGGETTQGEREPGKSGEVHGITNGNNGHGNDADHNDDSNPGRSNEENDVTDDEAPLEEPSSEEETDSPPEEQEPTPEPETEQEPEPEPEVEESTDDPEPEAEPAPEPTE